MEDENKLVQLTPKEELEAKLLTAIDRDELDNIVRLFNLDIKKRDILRTSKISELQDMIVSQMGERLENKADEFNNKDLLDFYKVIQDTINKADTSLDNIETPAIQVNQQININAQDTLFTKDSRMRIADAVLNAMRLTDTSIETEKEEVSEGNT